MIIKEISFLPKLKKRLATFKFRHKSSISESKKSLKKEFRKFFNLKKIPSSTFNTLYDIYSYLLNEIEMKKNQRKKLKKITDPLQIPFKERIKDIDYKIAYFLKLKDLFYNKIYNEQPISSVVKKDYYSILNYDNELEFVKDFFIKYIQERINKDFYEYNEFDRKGRGGFKKINLIAYNLASRSFIFEIVEYLQWKSKEHSTLRRNYILFEVYSYKDIYFHYLRRDYLECRTEHQILNYSYYLCSNWYKCLNAYLCNASLSDLEENKVFRYKNIVFKKVKKLPENAIIIQNHQFKLLPKNIPVYSNEKKFFVVNPEINNKKLKGVFKIFFAREFFGGTDLLR